MEKPLLHQPQPRDHPAETQTPSLLERLSNQEKNKTKLPLRERLSNKLKPWLNLSGRESPRNHKRSLKSVKSSPQIREEMSKSNLTHLSVIQQPSMESKPSLLKRMHMGPKSPTPRSENVGLSLVEEINDLKNLTGIMPVPPKLSTSTTSLTEYRGEVDSSMDWEITPTMMSQEMRVDKSQMLEQESEDVQTRSNVFMSLKCPGLAPSNESEDQSQTVVVTRPETSSKSSRETLLQSKGGSGVPLAPQQDSQAPSGMRSSRESQSILIPSSVLSITSTALTKASDVLDLLRSNLEGQSPRRKLKRAASGPLRSASSSKLLRSSSPTGTTSSGCTETTSRSSSLQSRPRSIQNYSNTMKPLDIKSVKVKTSCLPTEINSLATTKQSSPPMELELKERVREAKQIRERVKNLEISLTSAIDSMERTDVALQLTNANTNTFARNARKVDMENWNARSWRQCEELGRRPRYLRHNIFRNDELSSRSCAEWTEVAKPLASVPSDEYQNPLANGTISSHPDLFTVNTPIQVDNLERLLVHHPNPSFANSVVNGFREGFWPWADTHIGDYPNTLDESVGDPSTQEELDFICSQRDKEIQMGRFSLSFGKELLPGMYSMPIHAVPKPHSSDLRLVTNHSAGEFSLNSMIKREDIAGFPLDNMTHLGEMLLRKRKEHPDEELLLFKSDISEAYRNLPMHPLWQIKQINTIQGHRHVDRRNCFGGKASGSLFIAFNALVTWIGKNMYEIRDLASYSDDSFGVELARNLTFYEPYNRSLPTSQATLLTLWDHLGIPHKEKKQVHGSTLTIIGIHVDANKLTLTLPAESKSDLVTQLNNFARTPEGSGVRFALKDFQRLAGWFNWALNVYPLLKPALSNIYAKMAHSKPDKPLTKLYVNNAIRSDLLWAVDHLSRLPGTRVLQSLDWDPDTADVVAYCDASLSGLGFWFPGLSAGFWSPIPEDPPKDTIFYFEALSVLSAIVHSTSFGFPIDRLANYTDNLNTVQMFNSLSALPSYNELLKAAVDHLLSDLIRPIQLRVIHVPGDQNSVADALSRGHLHVAVDIVPHIVIKHFSPPRIRRESGAAKC
jgi:hypothetical protein